MECDFCDEISECEASGNIGKCWRFKCLQDALKDLQSQIETSLNKTKEINLNPHEHFNSRYDEFCKIERLAGYAKKIIEADRW